MRVVLSLGCILAFLVANSQGNLFSYTDLTIRSGTLFINGNWTHGDSTTTDKVYSQGLILLNGDLTNNSPTTLFGSDSTGSITFQGNLQFISGDSSIKFHDIFLASSGAVIQNQNPNVTGSLVLNTGQFQLNGYTLRLNEQGSIHNESNFSNIIGDSGHVFYMDPALAGPSALNLQGVGLVVQAPLINFGHTLLERHHSEILNVADSSAMRSYKWISAFGGNATSITLEYLDQWELNGLPEHNLSVYISTNKGITWRKLPSITDTILNRSTALNVWLDTCILTLANAHCANPPSFDISDTVWFCEGDSALVTTGLSIFHDWSNGATSDSVHLNVPGTYWVTGYDSAGCETIDTFTVVIDSIPNAMFTTSPQCQSDSVIFNNTSYYWNGTPNFFWDFGDTLDLGDTSLLGSPRHLYQNHGTWQGSLIASSPHGCSDTTTNPVTVFPSPIAGFSTSDICKHDLTQFIDTSSIAVGAITQYVWQFGDTNTATVQNPGHVYADTGTYIVKLKVTANTGCIDSASSSVRIWPLPNLSFSPGQGCASDTIQFNYTGDSITNVTWQFTATDSSQLLNPWFLFHSQGQHLIALRGTNPHGCTDTINQIISIDSIPPRPWNGGSTTTCGTTLQLDCGIPGATYSWSTGDTTQQSLITTTGWTNLAVQYSNGCTTSDSILVTLNALFQPDLGSDTIVCGSLLLDAGFPGSTYLWSDNDSVRYKNITQTGQYIVTVTDPNACVGSDTILITINAVPAGFLPSDTTLCEHTSLTIATSGSWLDHLWSNGDTTESTTFNSSGVHYCSVSDSNLCTGTDSILVSFGTRPSPTLPRWLEMCGAASTELYGDTTSQSWQWTKQNTLVGTTSRLTVTDTGVYVLTQTDLPGCIYQDTITVQERGYGINANFLVNSQSTIGDTLQFVNVSATEDHATKYHWTFGDGITSIDKHPTHIYYLTGSFTAELIAFNQYCTDTATKSIHVVAQKRDTSTQKEIRVYAESFDEMLVWPNPSFGKFNLHISSTGIEEFDLMLFEQTGRLIHKQHISNSNLTIPYRLGHPTSGLYFIVARAKEATRTVKVVVIQ